MRALTRHDLDHAVKRALGVMRKRERANRAAGLGDDGVEYLSGLDYGVRLMEAFLLEALYEEDDGGGSGETDQGTPDPAPASA